MVCKCNIILGKRVQEDLTQERAATEAIILGEIVLEDIILADLTVIVLEDMVLEKEVLVIEVLNEIVLGTGCKLRYICMYFILNICLSLTNDIIFCKNIQNSR